jgi:hypothetical protein
MLGSLPPKDFAGFWQNAACLLKYGPRDVLVPPQPAYKKYHSEILTGLPGPGNPLSKTTKPATFSFI